jgi:hypothetical protein
MSDVGSPLLFGELGVDPFLLLRRQYWINFAIALNPNGATNTISTTPLLWPVYEEQNKTSISFKVNATALIAVSARLHAAYHV